MVFDPRALEAAANAFAGKSTEAPAEAPAENTVEQPVSQVFKNTKTAERDIAVANKGSRVSVPTRIALPEIRQTGPKIAKSGSEKEAEMKAAVKSYNIATKLHSDLTRNFALTPKSPSYNAVVPDDASEEERPAHAYWNRAMGLHNSLRDYYEQLPKRLMQVHDSMLATADRAEQALPDLHPEHARILRDGIDQLRSRAAWIRDRVGEGGVQHDEAMGVLNRLVDVKASLASMKRPDGKFATANQARRHSQIIRNLGTLESIHKGITNGPLATFVAPPITRKLISETKGAAREELRTNEVLPPHLWPRDAHSAYAEFGDNREVKNPEPFKDNQGRTVRALSDPGHVWFEGARRAGSEDAVQVDARDDKMYEAMRAKYGDQADVVRRMKNMRDFAQNKGNSAFWDVNGARVKPKAIPRPKKSTQPLGTGKLGDLGAGMLPGQRVLSSDEKGGLTLTKGSPTSYVEETKQSQLEDALAQGNSAETYTDLVNKTKNLGAAGGVQEAADTVTGSESGDIGHGWLTLSTGEPVIISRNNLEAMRRHLGPQHEDVLKMNDELTKAETGMSASEQEQRVSKRREFAAAIVASKQKRERELTKAASTEGGIAGWNVEQARKGKLSLEGLEPLTSRVDPRFNLRGLQQVAGTTAEDEERER